MAAAAAQLPSPPIIDGIGGGGGARAKVDSSGSKSKFSLGLAETLKSKIERKKKFN